MISTTKKTPTSEQPSQENRTLTPRSRKSQKSQTVSEDSDATFVHEKQSPTFHGMKMDLNNVPIVADPEKIAKESKMTVETGKLKEVMKEVIAEVLGECLAENSKSRIYAMKRDLDAAKNQRWNFRRAIHKIKVDVKKLASLVEQEEQVSSGTGRCYDSFELKDYPGCQ